MRPTARVRLAPMAMAALLGLSAAAAFAPSTAAAPTGAWAPTGAMLNARGNGGGATLLTGPGCEPHCGEVLVAANFHDPVDPTPRPAEEVDEATAKAELYNPVAGAWVPTGSLNHRRMGVILTLLTGQGCGSKCGNVLAVGYDEQAELYDPASATWQLIPATVDTAGVQRAIQLLDGRVLAVKENGASFVYDPLSGASGTWTSTGRTKASIGVTDRAATFTLLTGPRCGPHCGKVLAVGGFTSTDFDASPLAQLYDPAAIEASTGRRGVWSLTGRMADARQAHAATLLPSGEVLVSGGVLNYNSENQPARSSAEIYDPTTGTWRRTGSLGFGRSAHTTTLLACGQVLAAGGRVSFSRALGDANTRESELYDPASGTWSATNPMAEARQRHAAVALADGTVLATGGGGPGPTNAALASAERYRPVGCAAPPPPPPPPSISIADTAVTEGNAGRTNATFTVTLSSASTATVSVTYASGDGTARAGEDYEATTGTLVFPANQTTRTVVVSVVGDTTAEADETFVVDLANPTNATLARAQATGTIANDDAGPGGPPPPSPTLPVVTDIDPAFGPVAGGTRVAITGARFAGTAAVRFGDQEILVHPCPVAATGAPPCFTEESPTRITAYSPARAQPAVVHVRVTTPAGISAETQADLFEYVDAPPAPGGADPPGQVALAGPPGGTVVTPAPPGGSTALNFSPGGSAAPGGSTAPGAVSAPGGSTAPGTVTAPGGSAAPGGSVAPSSVGSPVAGGSPLPMVGGAGAPSPGVAGMREEAPDFAPESNYHMVAHEGSAGPDPRGGVLAGIVTLVACSVGVVSARRERSRSGGCAAPGEAY